MSQDANEKVNPDVWISNGGIDQVKVGHSQTTNVFFSSISPGGAWQA